MNYSVPVRNIEALDKAMTRIGNKCAKLGIAFSYEKLGTCLKEVILPKIGAIKVEAIEVEVEGLAIINGWKFIAEIEHHETGNIVHSSVEAEEAWFSCEPKCEHCHTTKNRKVTYIIENESGERKQVGKSCLMLYTNGLSAEMAAECASVYRIAQQYAEDYESLSYDDGASDIRAFVSRSIPVIQANGYEKESFFSQYEDAKGSMGAKDELVEEFLKWVADYSPKSDYDHNAVNAVRLGYVILRKTGRIIASFIAKWLKSRPVEGKPASEYVGEVGKRIAIRVSHANTQTAILYFKRFFNGYMTIETPVYKIVDDDGNIYIYSGNALSAFCSYNGEVTIKATVKAHSEFKGEKQTVIVRPKEEYDE